MVIQSVTMKRSWRLFSVGDKGVVEDKDRRSLLRRTLQEYSQSSGLHGFRYLGEQERPWTERLWWSLALLTSLLGTGTLIFHVWEQRTQSPVLVSFAEHTTSIWDIPFPTVTVCPSNKYRKEVFDMSKTWRIGRSNMTEEDRKMSDDLMMVCRPMGEQQVRLEDYNYFSDDMSVKNIVNVAPTHFDSLECEDVISESNCSWMLSTVLTREGVCYSYNALPNRGLYRQESASTRQIWSLESGYHDDAEMKDLPVPATGAGFLQGVLLAVKTNLSDLDYTCRRLQGFKIMLTSPADSPRPFARYHWVPVTGLTQVAVTPHVVDTEDSLRGYSPHQRHCYFPQERRLSLFSTYTQGNCDIECLVNHTLRSCRCVDFYMPRNSSTPVCGYGAANCMYYAERELSQELMDERSRGRQRKNSCDCLPSCKAITYSAEISQGEIEVKEYKEHSSIDPEMYRNITANFVYIYLTENEILGVKRRELYGVTSFIASCGGLLGLCCGFSILSLVELLFFFTLRLWNNAGPEVADSSKKTRVEDVPAINKGWVGGLMY